MRERLPQIEENSPRIIQTEKLPPIKQDVEASNRKTVEEDERGLQAESSTLRQEIKNIPSQETISERQELGRRSSVTRIVGKDIAIPKEKIMENIRESFRYQPFQNQWRRVPNKWGSMKEREKTSEELQIISIVNDVTNQILKKYDLEKFDIPPENIHVMKRSIVLKIYEFLSLSKQKGTFNQDREMAKIVDPASKMDFANNLLHEMIHFKSYNAIQREMDEKECLGSYRVGLEVVSRDGKNLYFNFLNEAVTEELTLRTLPQIVEQPVLQDEKSKINDYSSYEKGREYLNDLVDVIFRENEDKFKDRDEVFEIFFKAMMTGNILPLGRIIEKTLGKGSFRRIGEI